LAGLSLTLADQKAVLFYLAFFPAFIDLSQVSYLDTAIVIGVTFLAVGGVKLFYAFMADRARLMFDPRINKRMNILAGVVTIAVGIFLLFKPQ
jgi:threonine/homoserine/homoserine lactone efflux protein